ncbi:hypothetical protein [Gracilinema caldarium]|uniref:Uncharacterized protein n=1 Tax=Gracilinema caldarium (strain ATCC 51460 / DSM 7334 / H1) TaxID=744872 RepID=F8EXF6_GRAC1|nr:hypothetical protein [Gracilinema caldarium]AEJ19183.1 hypothetical protein Spica_1034 [Gracilinema caldarium DSM 7334]
MRQRHIPYGIIGLGCILILLPLTLYAQTGTSQSGLQTNAHSGAFNKDQRFWFSAPLQERIVLNLDGKELFRGIGSTSVLLSVPVGAEKDYTIQVQRRSAPPDNTLLEEQNYFIHLDKQPPQKPVLTQSTEDGLIYTIRISCELDTVLEGVYYASGVIIPFDRNEEVTSFVKTLKAPLSLIVWAVDAAGNCSEPVSFSAEKADFSIISPAPGVWQNMQRLVIENRGPGTLYWTDDGSDPFSATGQLYEKPVLIQKTGIILLRIGIKLPNGLGYEKKITYRVESPGDDPYSIPEQIHTASILNVDGEYQWAIEPGPWLDKRIPIQLVPVESYRRFINLVLKNSRGIYRYPILLDGTGNEKSDAFELAGTTITNEAGLFTQNSEKTEQQNDAVKGTAVDLDPILVSEGPLRVLFWKNIEIGVIRYHITPETSWKDYVGPILVPPEPCTFEWIVDNGLAQEGPVQRVFKALEYQFPFLQGVIQYRSLYPEPGEIHTLAAFNGNDVPTFVACTGEDLEWSILTAEGKQLVLRRTDSLPPPEPNLTAPAEAAWVSGAVRIESSLPEAEEELKTIIQATFSYPSGKVEKRQAEGVLFIDVPLESPVAISIMSYAMDGTGNKGPVVSRNFTIDANSVYVSNQGSPNGDGSRNRPVNSLEQALEIAKQLGRSSIRIQDLVFIDKPLTLVPGFTIESSMNEQRGEIRLSKDGMLLVESGTIRIGRLTIRSDAEDYPAIEVHGGNLELSNTTIFMKGRDVRAIVSTSGEIMMSNSSINLDAAQSAIALYAGDCKIVLHATTLSVKAGKYAVGVEQRRGTFLQKDGSLTVTAQDGTIWLFSNLEWAQVHQVQAALVSNFVAQACIAGGFIPQVENSTFYFKGSARQASVFNFLVSEMVKSHQLQTGGTIKGNYFIGFNSLVHASDFPMDLKTFNRTFATPDAPNFVNEDP